MVEISGAHGASLLDAVDHLLNRGAVLVGHTTLSLAGVDLVYLGLNLVVSSVETLEQAERRRSIEAAPAGGVSSSDPHSARGALRSPVAAATDTSTRLRSEAVGRAAGTETTALPIALPERTECEQSERPEQGLARLVLALVELLRRLLERQAVRRMEGATVSEEEMERMGLALMALEDKMTEIREVFGLSVEDLDLDLGPLGRLLDERS